MLQSVLYDVRHASRMLRRAPLFSALVIATLALAIGANTAIFSVVNGVLLRSLPYAQPDRLVILYEAIGSMEPFGFSAPDLVAFRERARSYEGLAAFRSVEFELSGVDQPERVAAARISASLMDVLGVAPSLGRAFTATEDTGRQPVAILSDALWRRKFGADPAIVGKAVSLDRRAYTIVGVMPSGFTFPERGPRVNNVPADVYVPVSFTAIELGGFGMMYNNSVVARLKPGVSLRQAGAEAAAVANADRCGRLSGGPPRQRVQRHGKGPTDARGSRRQHPARARGAPGGGRRAPADRLRRHRVPHAHARCGSRRERWRSARHSGPGARG